VKFPVYIWFGPWPLHPHPVFESLAYFLAFQLILRQVRQDSLPSSQRTSVLVGGLVGALIGSKILVLAEHWSLLWPDWKQLLLLFLQGKTVVGGLLGALIGVELTKKWEGISRSTGDLFVYPLMLGIAIGRIGCFLTGLDDHTYGIATNLPWGIDFGDGIHRQPTQIYEIGFLLIFALFLYRRSHYPQQEGDSFRFFMLGYLSFRLVIDSIKPDAHPFWGLSAIQVACFLGMLYYYKSLFTLFTFARPVPPPS
jgi:phosphatidylglycerol---prolipoprotein diacylglyceryl transferase